MSLEIKYGDIERRYSPNNQTAPMAIEGTVGISSVEGGECIVEVGDIVFSPDEFSDFGDAASVLNFESRPVYLGWRCLPGLDAEGVISRVEPLISDRADWTSLPSGEFTMHGSGERMTISAVPSDQDTLTQLHMFGSFPAVFMQDIIIATVDESVAPHVVEAQQVLSGAVEGLRNRLADEACNAWPAVAEARAAK